MDGIDKIAIHNLFGVQGLDIAWYGIIIAAGIVVGVWIAIMQAKKNGYSADLIFDFMLIALPLSIVCARIYYVAFEWDYYSQHPEEIIQVWNGGIAIYGAIIGGIIAAIILSKWKKFPLPKLLDFAGPGLVMGQVIGRWGNFVNQEAYGAKVTDPALMFFPYAVKVQEQWYMATFFYESMWNIGVFILLMWYSKRYKHDGNVFAMYLIGYGIGRFWIEAVRVQTLNIGSVPVSQVVSAIIIGAGLFYILYCKHKKIENKIYEGEYCLDYEDKD